VDRPRRFAELIACAAAALLALPARAQAAADDFDLLPPAKVDPAALAREALVQKELGRRRTMLQLHQGLGLGTIAALGTAVALGQLNYIDKYGGGGYTERYIVPHKIAAYGATAVFAASGLLALLAPSPFEKPLRLDTAALHKASMIAATAGMAAQIVLGVLMLRKEGQLAQRDFALAHQIVGYATLAATTVGFVVLLFP